MDLEDQIALVTATWTPEQQLHAGNVAWHGAGCDGAPPCDVGLEGDGWFVEAWISTASNGSPRSAEIDGHFSPRLSATQRHKALEQVHALAPNGSLSLVTSSAMADTVRNHRGQEQDGPYFLLQHRSLEDLPDPVVPRGYTIVPAAEAGDEMRVAAHQTAWDPRRIKTLLGLPITGNGPPSSFSIDKYQRVKRVSIYRPELDLMVLAADGSPAAFALGWLDPTSRSVLFEPGRNSTRARPTWPVCSRLHRDHDRRQRPWCHTRCRWTTRRRRISAAEPPLHEPRIPHAHTHYELHLEDLLRVGRGLQHRKCL